MASQTETLTALIAPVVDSMGYEFVGLEYSAHGKNGLLRIYIDKQGGVLIEHCEQVSRQVSRLLDVENPIHHEYRLEVSSPGIERPLFTEAHFQRFQGERAKVSMKFPVEGQRNYVGTILSIVDGALVLSTDQGDISLNVNDIKKAHLLAEIHL